MLCYYSSAVLRFILAWGLEKTFFPHFALKFSTLNATIFQTNIQKD